MRHIFKRVQAALIDGSVGLNVVILLLAFGKRDRSTGSAVLIMTMGFSKSNSH